MSAEQDVSLRTPQDILAPSVVKGILFDMDGTLTDSDTLHFEAYQETLLKVRQGRDKTASKKVAIPILRI